MASPNDFVQNGHPGFIVKDLFDVVDDKVKEVEAKIKEIKDQKEKISIGEMFGMQMLMNKLAQLCEMSAGVVGACHTAIMSMARNMKQ